MRENIKHLGVSAVIADGVQVAVIARACLTESSPIWTILVLVTGALALVTVLGLVAGGPGSELWKTFGKYTAPRLALSHAVDVVCIPILIIGGLWTVALAYGVAGITLQVAWSTERQNRREA